MDWSVGSSSKISPKRPDDKIGNDKDGEDKVCCDDDGATDAALVEEETSCHKTTKAAFELFS